MVIRDGRSSPVPGCCTGCCIDGSVDDLRHDVAPRGDLAARDGAFSVTGNHEHHVDTAAWTAHLPTPGSTCCVNERVTLSRGAGSFDLAGIDDATAGASGVRGYGADLTADLTGRDTTTPVVLLAHQPVQVEQTRAAGVELAQG